MNWLEVFLLFAVLWLVFHAYKWLTRKLDWLFVDRTGDYLTLRGPVIRCDHNLIVPHERGVQCLKCKLVIES